MKIIKIKKNPYEVNEIYKKSNKYIRKENKLLQSHYIVFTILLSGLLPHHRL